MQIIPTYDLVPQADQTNQLDRARIFSIFVQRFYRSAGEPAKCLRYEPNCLNHKILGTPPPNPNQAIQTSSLIPALDLRLSLRNQFLKFQLARFHASAA
jgi:hypothetical protein